MSAGFGHGGGKASGISWRTITKGNNEHRSHPELETLIGDRDGDLGALAGREWDVAIDNPANIPRWVRLSAEALQGSVDKYVFVSSTGVYIPYLTEPAGD